MLTSEQIQFYQDNGYLLVKGMFTKEEAAAFRQEGHDLIDRIYQTETVDATWGGARQITAVQTKLLHCHDVQFYSAMYSKLIVDDRLTGAAADIIGSPNVQLHHTKMFIKPPEKGSPFPMHQDYPFFPHDHHSMIAAIIHFDNAPVEKGCVLVVPGSHKLGPLPTAADGNHLPLDKYPLESAVACPAEAGDVLFFSYLTIHGSNVNVSNEERTTLLVQMRDPQDPPSKLVHLSKGQGMMLRGINPIQGFIKDTIGSGATAPTMGPTMGGDAMSGNGAKM
jgi:ectoine hydroxylase-related dioxygenase (phytanoyl-CoA dioxygenase family)